MTQDGDRESATGRGRRRSHHACLNCRRKKTRCPGERPACSSCSRLGQKCSYAPVLRQTQGGRSEERLAHLEEKLDLLLSNNAASRNLRRSLSHEQPTQQQQTNPEDQHDIADKSQSPISSENDHGSNNDGDHNAHSVNGNSHDSSSVSDNTMGPMNHPSVAIFDTSSEDHSHISNGTSLRPSQPDLSIGISLYFKYCHRQPIWTFERDEVSDYASVPEELACSILALTARFHEKRDRGKGNKVMNVQMFKESAKTLVMLRIANGTVELTTIESLCLLSYSSFMDGNSHLGQFHLGLAFQLCRTARLDVESHYISNDPITERKKKLFWSLQLLEQFYGRQDGLLSVSTDIWRPQWSTATMRMVNGRPGAGTQPRAPPLPIDDLGCSDPNEAGIWNTSVHLAWVWSQVRRYVTNCAQQDLTEPWRHDSMYAQVLSDFMETENRIPICHRYDSAKFYKRKIMELKADRDYWAPWLKGQFTYHAIHTVLNHPFLYIVGAQHNPNLAIPNTFWRRSSELALLHATWIVRMIDMVVDKQVPLADPFFGHVAAVAATVHLYYCCATAQRLKHKSNTDFTKCRKFLKRFIPHSVACETLDRNLDKMTRMAAGPEVMDIDDWMPSKIYLNVPLMWDILQFTSSENSYEASTAGLLDSSLTPAIPSSNLDDSPTLEIVVATSPEISINTADGGQEAPTLSFRSAAGPTMRGSPWSGGHGPLHQHQTHVHQQQQQQQQQHQTQHNQHMHQQQMREEESMTFNFTPWLYADSAQFSYNGDLAYDDSHSGITEGGNMAWWEGDNMNNIMFNSF